MYLFYLLLTECFSIYISYPFKSFRIGFRSMCSLMRDHIPHPIKNEKCYANHTLPPDMKKGLESKRTPTWKREKMRLRILIGSLPTRRWCPPGHHPPQYPLCPAPSPPHQESPRHLLSVCQHPTMVSLRPNSLLSDQVSDYTSRNDPLLGLSAPFLSRVMFPLWFKYFC